ncbi:rhomboid family intramembrane serine protease [Agarivorans sp. MS3-6]|uniref:rhomboid family intramembrane serine protease n=1 Tax=Agarivorans sp. TSD2052 TaxID=2937286 RepID=UPI00200C8868|nr:rhomboid family intramembrane serine protease [Agarivorans sp. TSD2052]UPW19520.1 rhomboid family intramembrane serine protease [Agarivorans sp. TSD2052]
MPLSAPLKRNLRSVLILCAIMIFVQFINTLTLGSVSSLGIYPRSLAGLLGIPLAPFIHHSWVHLISNLVPFAILMMLVAQLGQKVLWLGSGGIILIGGILVWLFGSSGMHAGASGLIFGYWGLLLAYAWFNRSLKSLLIAALVLLIYGGMFFGLFSLRANVSWSSHIFGALSGVFMAWWLTNARQSK